MSDKYSQTVTAQSMALGPYSTTYGQLYEQWLRAQHPDTWRTISFEEWMNSGARQSYWGDRSKAPTKDKAE